MQPSKNNETAARLRREGNDLYRQRVFLTALEKYNESICWAKGDSEDLGIAYANRSAVYYELGAYEAALASITLAKRNNYPGRLMAKLEARERECRINLEQNAVEDVEFRNLYAKLQINVEVNPRIPHIAKDLVMEEVATGLYGMCADRDFKVGDVLLQEKSLLGCWAPASTYHGCDCCVSDNFYNLIPCPHCVTTMYCSEECRQKGWNRFHRFECDITGKLHATFDETNFAYVAARMFFYGLGLFQDDVPKMMQFVKTHPRTGSDPLSLDYVNYDPMEEFKMIQMTKHRRTMSTVLYPVESVAIAYYKTYRKSPRVKSLFNTKTRQRFMRNCFVDYFLSLPWHNPGISNFEFNPIGSASIKTPTNTNTTIVNVCGELKFVVHRAIPKGDSINLAMEVEPLDYTCNCPYCTEGTTTNRQLMIINKILADANIDQLAKFNALKQFLQKYSTLQSRSCYQSVVKAFQRLLHEIHVRQKCRELFRGKL